MPTQILKQMFSSVSIGKCDRNRTFALVFFGYAILFYAFCRDEICPSSVPPQFLEFLFLYTSI